MGAADAVVDTAAVRGAVVAGWQRHGLSYEQVMAVRAYEHSGDHGQLPAILQEQRAALLGGAGGADGADGGDSADDAVLLGVVQPPEEEEEEEEALDAVPGGGQGPGQRRKRR